MAEPESEQYHYQSHMVIKRRLNQDISHPFAHRCKMTACIGTSREIKPKTFLEILHALKGIQKCRSFERCWTWASWNFELPELASSGFAHVSRHWWATKKSMYSFISCWWQKQAYSRRVFRELIDGWRHIEKIKTFLSYSGCLQWKMRVTAAQNNL